MTGTRFRYTGQQFLGSLNLYYYKARFYSPALGRFLQTDPIGTADDLNLYAYVGNNPINFNDPSGLSAAAASMLLGKLGSWGRENAGTLAEIGIGFTPAGFYTDLYSAVAGRTPITGDSLSGWERVAILIPGVSEIRNVGKVVREAEVLTSRAARREVMRNAGIPTSQQPLSQSRNASGREYSYDVPAPGGGNQRMSVQQQTMDRSHPDQAHWEAGPVKIDPITGAVRENNYGRPTLTNSKTKIDY